MRPWGRDGLDGAAAHLGRVALGLGIGFAGGWAFDQLHLPLPWMLGAMAATMATALLRAPLAPAAALRGPMTGVIGALLGSNITPESLDRMVQSLPSLAALAVFMVLCTAVNGVYYRRIGGFDADTAFLAGTPSGLIEMVALGRKVGADTETIALVHGSRIFLVTLLLSAGFQYVTGTRLDAAARMATDPSDHPLVATMLVAGIVVAGLGLGRLLRFPAASLTGPLAVSALWHVAGPGPVAFPGPLVVAAQLVVGTTIGCGFVRYAPRRVLEVLALTAGSTLMLLALTVAAGSGMAALTGAERQAMILGYSPGGLTEMSLVALALHVDVAVVAVHHIARFVLVALAAPFAFALFRRLAAAERPARAPSDDRSGQ